MNPKKCCILCRYRLLGQTTKDGHFPEETGTQPGISLIRQLSDFTFHWIDSYNFEPSYYISFIFIYIRIHSRERNLISLFIFEPPILTSTSSEEIVPIHQLNSSYVATFSVLKSPLLSRDGNQGRKVTYLNLTFY